MYNPKVGTYVMIYLTHMIVYLFLCHCVYQLVTELLFVLYMYLFFTNLAGLSREVVLQVFRSVQIIIKV
jgi:hypothetical protein